MSRLAIPFRRFASGRKQMVYGNEASLIMNVLFVPSIGLDDSLIRRLADSVDYPIKWKCALNNGPLGALEKFGNDYPDWHIKETGQNHGVAGSWNACAKWFSSEPCWLLMNEDAHFLPGYLEKICSAADHNQSASIIYLNESRAFYCFVSTLIGRMALGDFDENFWPAYYEDCDYRVRMKLLGVENQCVYALPDLPPLPRGKPRTGGGDYNAMLQGAGLLTRAYWRRKWGSDNRETPEYQTPYRDHRLTYRDVVWYPELRAQIYPLWEAFINKPGASIYE